MCAKGGSDGICASSEAPDVIQRQTGPYVCALLVNDAFPSIC